MAIRELGAVEGTKPPGRLHALFRPRTKRGTSFVYSLFFVPLALFSVAFPLTPVIAGLVFYRFRHYRWAPLFTFCVTLASFFSLFWFSLVLSAYASAVYGALFAGGYVEALLARPFVFALGSIAGGTAAGLTASAWDWQRKPPYARDEKSPTLLQERMLRRERKAIAAGELDEPGIITFGTEAGPDSLGRTIQARITNMTHSIILGRTGMGKTQTAYRFVDGFLSQDCPVIALDMKAAEDTIDGMRAFAKKYNRPFYLFSVSGDNHWDALRDKPSASVQKDILMDISVWSDEYYKTMADEALLNIFSALQVGGPGPGESMVQAASRLLDPAQLKQYVQKNLSFAEHSELRNQVLTQANLIEANPTVFSGVRGQLSSMVRSDLGKYFTPGEGMFSLRQAFNENAVVLFSLDPDRTSQGPSAMVLADVMALGKALMREKNEKPCLFWADEFTKARAGYIATMMQQLRESGIKILLGTQGVSDILGAGRSYEGGSEAYQGIVLSQADLIISHRVEDDTAGFIERASGEQWVFEYGPIETHRKDSILDSDSGATADRGYIKPQRGPNVRVAQLTGLPKGHAVMIGAFEVGHLRKKEKLSPKKKRKADEDAPHLVVNHCHVVMSNLVIEAQARVKSAATDAKSDLIPDAVPTQLEATTLPEPSSSRASKPGPVAGLGPAGTATPAAGTAGGGVAPFMFDKKNEDDDGEPEYGGFF